ncbi:MAG: hypothetical protein M3019_06620 [Candidatus Dormibacteraeota bacterium]|nr:hypothetical protein [Candidatus Dormibacteraeota bacterium]
MTDISPGAAPHAHFVHIPHPRLAERHERGPVKVADQVSPSFNGRLALRITAIVGTMWCAYAFAVLALVVLPQATSSPLLLVQWISQTFIQLVMLSILMVGQNIQGKAADQRAADTYKDAEAILHECLQLQEHLHAQDKVLDHLVARLAKTA